MLVSLYSFRFAPVHRDERDRLAFSSERVYESKDADFARGGVYPEFIEGTARHHERVGLGFYFILCY